MNARTSGVSVAVPTLPNPLVNPLAHVRARFQRWWQARLPLSDSVTLTQRNVYILPTWPGFMLGATLLVLLVASINYQLNLGYLLTFLLAGSAVVGMHVCHGTLRGMTLNLIAPDPQYAGASAVIGINIVSDRKRVRHGLQKRVGKTLIRRGHDKQVCAAIPIAWVPGKTRKPDAIGQAQSMYLPNYGLTIRAIAEKDNVPLGHVRSQAGKSRNQGVGAL